MGARSGPWANVRTAVEMPRCVDGRRHCSSKRCRLWRAFSSPRAWSFTLLGLDAYCASVAAEIPTRSALRASARRQVDGLLAAAETRGLGMVRRKSRVRQRPSVPGPDRDGTLQPRHPPTSTPGLRSLRWLMTSADTPAGHFQACRIAKLRCQARRRHAPSTSNRWRRPPRSRPAWPRGVPTAIPAWRADAARAFAWFLGSNDLSSPLVDVETGSCRDGLHPDRANENRGGESAVSYLLSLAEMRELAHLQR